MEDIQAAVCPAEIPMNQACLTVSNNATFTIEVWTQSTECFKCPLMYQRSINSSEIANITVDTWYKTQYFINGTIDAKGCGSTYAFEDYGQYTLNVAEDKYGLNLTCSLETVKKGANIYLPLLYAFIFYACIGIVWILGKHLYRRGFFNKFMRKESIEISSEELNAAYSVSSISLSQASQQKKRRLRSLDTFRGLSITIMIFVNYGGGNYQFFHHALWNGLTVADLVFPWFIWIMGVSMALSLCSLLRKSIPRFKIFRKIVKRTVILFALGLMLNTFSSDATNLDKIRILGVLQRFAISYFVIGTVHLFFAKPQDIYEHTTWAIFRDIFGYWVEWLFMLAILAAHVLLTFLIDIQGCGRGYLGPGGIQDNENYFNCTGGAAGYIDRIVLGKGHLYKHPTFKKMYYGSLPYDPEGLLGCLTSIFLVFLGLQAGKILLTYKEWKPRIIRWMLWGILTGGIAAILCKCSQNDGWIPINKNLWSVSFIMVNASFSFILLSICYLVCDVLGWWSGAPFYYPGMNSILLYVGHELTSKMFPWAWEVDKIHWQHLAINLWGTSLWVIISIWLYYKKFFLAI